MEGLRLGLILTQMIQIQAYWLPMDVLSTPCSACKPALMMRATDQGPDLWTAVLPTHVALINLKYSAILPIHLGGILFLMEKQT